MVKFVYLSEGLLQKLKGTMSLGNFGSQQFLIRPAITDKHEVLQLAWKHFGLIVEEGDASVIKELISFGDRNFYIKGFLKEKDRPRDESQNVCGNKKEYLLKVMHSCDTYNPDLLEAIDLAMAYISDQNNEYKCPWTMQSLSGDLKILADIEVPADYPHLQTLGIFNGEGERNSTDSFFKLVPGTKNGYTLFMKHYVRLLTFLPGRPFPDGEVTDDLVYKAGQFTAKVRMSLKVNFQVLKIKFLIEFCVFFTHVTNVSVARKLGDQLPLCNVL